MADVVKALALVSCSSHCSSLDIGKAPCTEGAPMIPKQDVSGRPADDS